MNFLFKSLEEVVEEIHSMKLGVIVGGAIWMTLPVASRKRVAKIS